MGDEELRKAPDFTNEASMRHVVFDGVNVELYKAPSAIRNGLFQDLQDLGGGGYAFDGFTARLAPSDFSAIKSDPTHIAQFATWMAGDQTGTAAPAALQTKSVTSGRLVAELDDIVGGGDVWDQKAAFEKQARIAVRSLLSQPAEAIYRVTYCADWCDEELVAVMKSGEVRTLYMYGDQ
jgi:hypothetical protein